MEPTKINKYKKSGPEKEIQTAIIKYLKERDWFVVVTHGNEFQMGLPDLYAAHYTLGTRWIEVKNPLAYSFTPAQREVFPQLQSKGVGIWIMTAADDYEYQKLFQPYNWYHFLGKSSYSRQG
ncbi:MAG TPA: hypothetical protein VM260_03575 [Pirellula sp.]|nr:hypothetical protein [Pirellula sp.]